MTSPVFEGSPEWWVYQISDLLFKMVPLIVLFYVVWSLCRLIYWWRKPLPANRIEVAQ